MGESTKDTFPDSFELLIQRCIAELEARGPYPPPARNLLFGGTFTRNVCGLSAVFLATTIPPLSPVAAACAFVGSLAAVTALTIARNV